MDDSTEQVFRYALVGAGTPDRVRFLLPEGTYVVDLTLASASTPGGRYRRRAQYVVHRADEAMHFLDVGGDRYFELRVGDKGGGVHAGVPVLRLGFPPARLVFRADGTPPYLIAHGSALSRCSKFAASELVGDAGTISNADTATIVAQRTLGGDAALQTPPPPVPWRTYALWTVLIIAVLVLVLVALRLLERA